MTVLIAGLLLFLGTHSIRIVADDWRSRTIARVGEKPWKGLYSLVSLVGFILLVWGYGVSRSDPVFIWNPPLWTRHLAMPLTLVAFILIAAAYVPGNHFKKSLGHPMYAGVKIWAFAHLAANGRLGDIILFGTFLIWAIVGFACARRRDRKAGIEYPPAQTRGTLMAVIAGTLAWAVFAFVLHRMLIGVSPI